MRSPQEALERHTRGLYDGAYFTARSQPLPALLKVCLCACGLSRLLALTECLLNRLRVYVQSASATVLMGDAFAAEYKKFSDNVLVIPHGFFNLDSAAAKPTDLGLICIGSFTVWGDMR